MKYAIDQQGGPTILILENGDSIMVRAIVGHITEDGTNPDGTTKYSVQVVPVTFSLPAEKTKATAR
jgi:hypothetical protein